MCREHFIVCVVFVLKLWLPEMRTEINGSLVQAHGVACCCTAYDKPHLADRLQKAAGNKKSSLSYVTQVAAYEFTTLTCIPGVVHYRGAKIQMLDLPGIIEGAKDGKGRGRQVGLQSLYMPCAKHKVIMTIIITMRASQGEVRVEQV